MVQIDYKHFDRCWSLMAFSNKEQNFRDENEKLKEQIDFDLERKWKEIVFLGHLEQREIEKKTLLDIIFSRRVNFLV